MPEILGPASVSASVGDAPRRYCRVTHRRGEIIYDFQSNQIRWMRIVIVIIILTEYAKIITRTRVLWCIFKIFSFVVSGGKAV